MPRRVVITHARFSECVKRPDYKNFHHLSERTARRVPASWSHPPEITSTSQHYGTEGLKGGPQSVPNYAERTIIHSENRGLVFCSEFQLIIHGRYFWIAEMTDLSG